MSKGSKRRPVQITADEEQKRWDLAFGRKDKDEEINSKCVGINNDDSECSPTCGEVQTTR